MGPRRCIISLATADKRYPQGLARLLASARTSGFDGDFITWPPGRFPDGCPPHREVPFAFKPFCFQEARRKGMHLVLWLDSSCVVVRPLDDVFRQMEERGYVLFRNGDYRLGEWASDEALARCRLSREEAMTLPEVRATAIGLNLRTATAIEFLDRWFEHARDGTSFRGVAVGLGTAEDYWNIKWNRRGRASTDPRVRGHRHDQTVAGILAHRLGMQLTAEGIEVCAQADGKTAARTVIVIHRDFIRGLFEGSVLRRMRTYLWRRSTLLRRWRLGRLWPRLR